MATKCTSLTALNMNMCPGEKYPMGYAAKKYVKGNLFLETNGNSPFGKNNKNIELSSCDSTNEQKA